MSVFRKNNGALPLSASRERSKPREVEDNDKIEAPLEHQSVPNEEKDHVDAKSTALDRGQSYRLNCKKF